MNKEPVNQPNLPFEELRRVVRLMKDNDLSVFQFERGDLRIKLRRGPEISYATLPAAAMPAQQVAPPVSPVAAVAAAADAEPAAEGEDLASPMVGTFYRSPTPNDPPFVKVGDSVTVGQTVCIIEAMKVMNEIKVEKSGLITAIVAEDGTAVQFGEPLMRIK
jgi:acetyl-CoA carboxylase biotin carboxyl carrier protein